MSKDEVLKIMEKDLRFSGSMYIALGIFFLLPFLFILLLMIDTVIEVPGGDIIGLFKGQLLFSVFTIPAIILIRSGIRKRKVKNNKIYSSYADTPDKIVWVYERFSNLNGRDMFCVTLCDDSGKSYEIQSSMYEYRTLCNSIRAHCENAAYGFNEEWRDIYKRNPKNFKANVRRDSISL